MTREELKRLWFSIPTDPNKKQENTIVVEMDNYPARKGEGTVQITRDGPDGYSQFTTHQKNPLQYALDRMSEGDDGLRDLSKYQLIIK
tara:strand:+ start:201 stop:464 length:264 start_codon:yes stop_codon:yes gene_type:complete